MRPAICHAGAAAHRHTHVTSHHFSKIASAHFRRLTEEMTLILQHHFCIGDVIYCLRHVNMKRHRFSL